MLTQPNTWHKHECDKCWLLFHCNSSPTPNTVGNTKGEMGRESASVLTNHDCPAVEIISAQVFPTDTTTNTQPGTDQAFINVLNSLISQRLDELLGKSLIRAVYYSSEQEGNKQNGEGPTRAVLRSSAAGTPCSRAV